MEGVIMRTPNQYATSELRAVELMYSNSKTDDLVITKADMFKILEAAYIEGAIKSRMR